MCVGSERLCATRRSLTVRIRLTLGLPLVAEGPRERQIWKEGALKRPSFDSVGARRASTRRVGRNGEGQPVDRYSTPGTKALWAVWLHQALYGPTKLGTGRAHTGIRRTAGERSGTESSLLKLQDTADRYGGMPMWTPDVWIHVQISTLGIAAQNRTASCHATSTAPSRAVTWHSHRQHI